MRFIFFILFSFDIAYSRCHPITWESLSTKLNQDRNWDEIVFFASWCASCKPHLLSATTQSILISTLDTPTESEATLQALQINSKIKCFIDEKGTIREKLGVKNLPMKITRSDSSKILNTP